ncbi:MAG: hypothetical protein IKP79_02450, partial [Bacilli bacterium]|nr:hypothetical protein [Bacilli bacterium]
VSIGGVRGVAFIYNKVMGFDVNDKYIAEDDNLEEIEIVEEPLEDDDLDLDDDEDDIDDLTIVEEEELEE